MSRRHQERMYTVGQLIRVLESLPLNRRVVVSVVDYGKPLIMTGYALDLFVQEIDDVNNPHNGAVWILGVRNEPD